jgi:AraC-like DNA-binding protein
MQTNDDNKKLLPEPLAYDIDQTAAALNMSKKSVRRLLRRRLLTSCKALRKVLIPRKQVEDFVKGNCDTPRNAT